MSFGELFELEKVIGKGHLQGCINQTANRFIEFDIFLDTNQGYLLKYQGTPNALFGFEITQDVLMMHQLQGITGFDYWNNKKIHPIGLQKIDWKQKFLDFKIDLARKLNIPYIGIVSANNLPYNTTTLINNYDLLAIKNSYTQRSNGNFVKKI